MSNPPALFEPDYDPDYDPVDDDDVDAPPLVPRFSPNERANQDTLRTQLFARGSDFKPTYREDIVGIDNVLGEIDEIIHWLAHSEKYARYQSRLQPGVIFAGSPGTGKTLVSRWIATASDALFVNVRDFVHQGALFNDADIRDLFERARATYAKDNKPLVLFWDEFENSAIERGSDKTTPEQRSVVSQLTAELDGIHGKNEGIVLIGCTNYLSSIDGALMRRGRMGVQIEFHAPDRAGKEKILAFYLGKMSTANDIDINTLSYFFPKSNTAADIEEACVEAWRHAVRRSIDQNDQAKNVPTDMYKPRLDQEDLVKVFVKQLVGPPTTFTIPEDERLPIAIHESGHAIAALSFGVPLRLITVQPGKKSLGRVMVDDVNQYSATIPEAYAHMRTGLGGLIAERVAEIEPMAGSHSDIHRVNNMIQELVDDLGQGERMGLFSMAGLSRTVGYTAINPPVSAELMRNADYDVRDILHRIEEETQTALARVGRDNLRQIAARVNDQVTMTGREFRELFIDVCGFEPELA